MGLYGFEKSLFEVLSPTFEYGFALSGTGEFQHDSFVNNLATTEGGTHVNIVTSQIVAVIAGYFETKFKKSNAKLSKASIKNKLHVFVNIRVTNPEFRSQAKSYLTSSLKKTDFAIHAKRALATAKSSGMLDVLEEMLNSREMDALSKSMSGSKKRVVNVEKLIDASLAGTARSDQCSLYLCEGDSARTFCVSGFSKIGTKTNGVYPLKVRRCFGSPQVNSVAVTLVCIDRENR